MGNTFKPIKGVVEGCHDGGVRFYCASRYQNETLDEQAVILPLPPRGHEWVCVPKQHSLRARLDAALTPEQVRRLRKAVKAASAKRKGTRKEASK